MEGKGSEWNGGEGIGAERKGFFSEPGGPMQFEKIEFHVKGLTPQVWHNGQLADKTNRYALAMAEITGKKKKTEEDLRRLEDLEWEGSLYLDGERRPVVPGEVIQGAFWEAGKKKKCGADVRNGLTSPGPWPILYDGPKTLDKL